LLGEQTLGLNYKTKKSFSKSKSGEIPKEIFVFKEILESEQIRIF